MTDDEILEKMDIVELNPKEEEWVRITDHIDLITVEQLIDRWHFIEEEGPQRDYLKYYLYFLANLYYGDNYQNALKRLDSTYDARYSLWYSNIREEALKLYLDVDNYKRAVRQAQNDKLLWEINWQKQKASERATRKKQLVKQLEEDYGPIEGDKWKDILKTYSEYSDQILDKMMDQEMMENPEWKGLLKKEKAAKSVHIRFGKEKGRQFPNFNRWFIDLLENHLFPWFIPDIIDVDSAKAELNREAGRKPEDQRLRAIVNGTANYFFDVGWVKSRTQSNLLGLLENLLNLMTITCSDGTKADKKKIMKLIENLPNAESSSKFYTQESTPIEQLPDISMMEVVTSSIGWLAHPDPEARKTWGLKDPVQTETPPESNPEESQEASPDTH